MNILLIIIEQYFMKIFHFVQFQFSNNQIYEILCNHCIYFLKYIYSLQIFKDLCMQKKEIIIFNVYKKQEGLSVTIQWIVYAQRQVGSWQVSGYNIVIRSSSGFHQPSIQKHYSAGLLTTLQVLQRHAIQCLILINMDLF